MGSGASSRVTGRTAPRVTRPRSAVDEARRASQETSISSPGVAARMVTRFESPPQETRFAWPDDSSRLPRRLASHGHTIRVASPGDLLRMATRFESPPQETRFAWPRNSSRLPGDSLRMARRFEPCAEEKCLSRDERAFLSPREPFDSQGLLRILIFLCAKRPRAVR